MEMVMSKNLNKTSRLSESDLAQDKMGDNSLQGNDQANVRNQRQGCSGRQAGAGQERGRKPREDGTRMCARKENSARAPVTRLRSQQSLKRSGTSRAGTAVLLCRRVGSGPAMKPKKKQGMKPCCTGVA
jgi:hypothetical protein